MDTPADGYSPTQRYAREAAAELAYPRERYGRRVGTLWAAPIVAIRHAVTDGVDMSWNDGSGNCVGVDTELMYPERGRRADQAKAVCVGCPLLEPCREHGIRHEYFGVFGGLSENERRVIRRQRYRQRVEGGDAA